MYLSIFFTPIFDNNAVHMPQTLNVQSGCLLFRPRLGRIGGEEARPIIKKIYMGDNFPTQGGPSQSLYLVRLKSELEKRQSN